MDQNNLIRNQQPVDWQIDSHYPDPDEVSTPHFSWIQHHQPIPAEDFPRPPSSLVFEGFIPEDGPSGSYERLDVNDNVTDQHSSFHMSPESISHQRHSRDINDSAISEYSGEQTDSEDNDNDISTDESETPEDVDQSQNDGVYSRTRSRQDGKPRLLWAPPKKQSTKFRGRGGWSKGLRLGPRPPLEPGDEFNSLFQEASNAFIDQQDNDRALELTLKAISLNPEIYPAHALLSEIYFAIGDGEKAVTSLFAGAHSAPKDAAVWLQLAEICLQKSPLDRQTRLEQGRYCFTHLLQIDVNDHESRFQRATIDQELGNHSKALRDFEFLLKKMPHNSNILRQIAEACIEMNDVKKAKEYYEEAIDHSRGDEIPEEEIFSWSDLNVYVDLVAKGHQYGGTISNAIFKLKQLARWLQDRDSETFWDQYTEDDREWDSEDAPRRETVKEYQPGRYPIESYGIGLPLELRVKLGVLRIKEGVSKRHEALDHLAWLQPEDGEDGAVLYEYSDLFLQAAHALAEANEHEQALRFYEPLKEHFASSEDPTFWLGIATSSYICGKKDQAIECYETVKAVDDIDGEARVQLSKLYSERGNKEKATQNARQAVRIAEESVRRTDRRKYEKKEQRFAREAAESALKQANRLPGPRVPYAGQSTWHGRHFRSLRRLRSAPSLTSLSARLHQQQVQQSVKRKRTGLELDEAQRQDSVNQAYVTLVDNTSAMRAGGEMARNIWMDCANSLVEDFRKNRVFYPYERHMQFKGYDRESRTDAFRKKWQKLAGQRTVGLGVEDISGTDSLDPDHPLPSIESSVPRDYRGIPFSDWLDIFLEYALLLANSPGLDAQEQCYTVITAALDCVVWYHDRDAMLQIHCCYLTCAIALGDEQTLFNTVIRWFMRQYQFCTDAYRLFAAMNFLFKYPTDKNGKAGQMANSIFRSAPNNKFLFRQIMSLDSQLPDDYDAPDEGPVPDFMRQKRNQPTIDPEDREHPTLTMKPQEMDVVLLALYGHILYAGGSFPNALSYFYRALSLDPNNTVVLLSMALSYMHQMFKRQNDNRHLYLLQGWALYERYADARREWARSQGDEMTKRVVEREIEFNRSRCWHMLGMSDLAIRGYEKVLGSHRNGDGDEIHGDDGQEQFSMEAAYAMQIVYALNGDVKSAREITEKWLVVE